jgi:hypothetical protein
LGPRPIFIVLCLALVAFGSLVAGCSSGDDNSSSGGQQVTPEQKTAAADIVEVAAAKVASATDDKYLDPKKTVKVVCRDPETPAPEGSPASFICHVEAFGTLRGGNGRVYLTSEDWRMQVDPDGKLSKPTLEGEGRVRTYLRLDNRYNCTNHKSIQEKCIPSLLRPEDSAAESPVP